MLSEKDLVGRIDSQFSAALSDLLVEFRDSGCPPDDMCMVLLRYSAQIIRSLTREGEDRVATYTGICEKLAEWINLEASLHSMSAEEDTGDAEEDTENLVDTDTDTEYIESTPAGKKPSRDEMN